MAKVRHTVYLHRDKDSNNDTWFDELRQPDNEARETFKYCGYEVGFDCEVDLDTGKVVADGVFINKNKVVKLVEPLEIT